MGQKQRTSRKASPIIYSLHILFFLCIICLLSLHLPFLLCHFSFLSFQAVGFVTLPFPVLSFFLSFPCLAFPVHFLCTLFSAIRFRPFLSSVREVPPKQKNERQTQPQKRGEGKRQRTERGWEEREEAKGRHDKKGVKTIRGNKCMIRTEEKTSTPRQETKGSTSKMRAYEN